MQHKIVLAWFSLALSAHAAGPLPLATPLVVDGPIVVDAADFEGAMLRVPEARRPEFRMSYDRVASLVDQVFLTRVLAGKAREAGLDKDPAIQKRLQQLQEGLLADLYTQKLEREAVSVTVDHERRARELYLSNLSAYKVDEQVYLQQILITLQGRTRETALERARQAYAAAVAGKEDFLAVGARFTDENDRRRTAGSQGDLGMNSAKSFVEPIQKAIAAMKPLEISQPVESEYGFHILRLVERKPATTQPFDAVKKQIIAAEKERLQKAKVEAITQSIRGSSTVIINRANVEKLVAPIDPEVLKKALEEANAPPKK